jgi:hypothetical protein
MKNLGSFLVGTLTSLGVYAALPDTLNTASAIPQTVVDSIEALISLISGILSALLVAWLKQKLEKGKVN